jgi:Uma2 family endonuclease
MATAILIQDELEIPAIRGLDDFRGWAKSDRFPEAGRIDFIAGRVEVDMSPEELHTHGKPKIEMIRVLANRMQERDLGELYTDRTRVSHPESDLSVEPDLVFVANGSLDSGRVRFVPKAGKEGDRYIELEGVPDLIVEIVSDSSVRKDTKRLPRSYWRAGVREFWLVDMRGEEALCRIHHRGPARYVPAPMDDDSYQYSTVFGVWYRLDRSRNSRGHWQYTLREKQKTVQ